MTERRSRLAASCPNLEHFNGNEVPGCLNSAFIYLARSPSADTAKEPVPGDVWRDGNGHRVPVKARR